MKNSIVIPVVVVASIAGVLGLSACTNSSESAMPTQSSVETSAPMGEMMSDSDIMFAQMMIPHHEQAVEMSTLAETRSQNAELLALARQIKDAQAPEIADMTTWLNQAGAPMSMGHSMGDDGMLSDDEMTALEKATGTEFDKLYLTGMISHHEGAVAMAKSVASSSNTKVKALSDKIISSQTAEIEKMKQMLAAL